MGVRFLQSAPGFFDWIPWLLEKYSEMLFVPNKSKVDCSSTHPRKLSSTRGTPRSDFHPIFTPRETRQIDQNQGHKTTEEESHQLVLPFNPRKSMKAWSPSNPNPCSSPQLFFFAAVNSEKRARKQPAWCAIRTLTPFRSRVAETTSSQLRSEIWTRGYVPHAQHDLSATWRCAPPPSSSLAACEDAKRVEECEEAKENVKLCMAMHRLAVSSRRSRFVDGF